MVGDEKELDMDIENNDDEEDVVQQRLQEKNRQERKIQKITLTYEEYERIAKSLLYHVREIQKSTKSFVQ